MLQKHISFLRCEFAQMRYAYKINCSRKNERKRKEKEKEMEFRVNIMVPGSNFA